MMTMQERERVRGTMQPRIDLSEAEYREIIESGVRQAEAAYDLADNGKREVHHAVDRIAIEWIPNG